jgi:hypothetical protein
MFKLVKDRGELGRVISDSEVASQVGSKILGFIEFWSQEVDALVVHVSPNACLSSSGHWTFWSA